MPTNRDSWHSGSPYEQFMGRWSRPVAQKFLKWLAVPKDHRWLDIGSGTGVLTKLILEGYQPHEVIGIDSSKEFIAHSQQSINHPSARFQVGLAQSLDLPSNSIDAVVSGLTLNFVPQPEAAVAEMLRVTKPGGQVGIFLWDYAGGMGMLRRFWDAAIALDDLAKELDEGVRFPLCREGQLESLLQSSGVAQVEAAPIEVATVFKDFDDYWQPFLGAVGPAPGYAIGLPLADRQRLEDRLHHSLPVAEDGSISLTAKAWAVKGSKVDAGQHQ